MLRPALRPMECAEQRNRQIKFTGGKIGPLEPGLVTDPWQLITSLPQP